jgi:N-acyl-D-aspartate/D-glutamate deacylase
MPMLDLVLRNARIVDGRGATAFDGDIGIADGRIVSVGTVADTARREIDCDGAVAAPGFIDVHTHYDAQVFWDRNLTPSVNHGVTTVLAGNCGFTLAPLSGKAEDSDYLVRMLSRVEGMPLETLRAALRPDWTSFGEYLDRLDGKLAINTAFLVGHSALRRTVMGERAVGHEATPSEIDAICDLLGRSLAEGGAGFSTSVSFTHTDFEGEPVPSRSASREELLRLAEVVAHHPGTWIEFAPNLAASAQETYELGTLLSLKSQRPVNWNLIVVDSKRPAAREAQLKAGDFARERGGIVYGLTPSIPPKVVLNFVTGFVLDFIPGWSEVILLPRDEKLRALADPQVRSRLREGVAKTAGMPVEHMFADFGALTIETIGDRTKRQWIGRTLGEYAATLAADPLETLFDLAVENELDFSFSPPSGGDDTESWKLRAETWRDDCVLIGASDAGAHLDMINTFAFSTQLLAEGVRKHKLLPLEEAVHRITHLLAQRFGIKDRGLLAPGMAADVVVFDPDTVDCGPCEMRNDLPENGLRLTADAIGVHHVVVNGTPVIVDGSFTGDKGGRVLRSGIDTETIALPQPIAA